MQRLRSEITQARADRDAAVIAKATALRRLEHAAEVATEAVSMCVATVSSATGTWVPVPAGST